MLSVYSDEGNQSSQDDQLLVRVKEEDIGDDRKSYAVGGRRVPKSNPLYL